MYRLRNFTRFFVTLEKLLRRGKNELWMETKVPSTCDTRSMKVIDETFGQS